MNIFLRLNCLTLLLLFLAQSSFGQSNFTEGYIILPNGDSISGYVDYREWTINPESISFKEKLDQKSSVFSATDIQRFGTSDERYITAVIEVDLRLNVKGTMVDTKKTGSFFLQVLVDGEKSLYRYRANRNGGTDRFYISRNGDIELLENNRYIKNVNGSQRTVEDKKYIGQLTLYFDKNPCIEPYLDKLKYADHSLTQVFSKYYECTNSSAGFVRHDEKLKINLGFIAGVSMTQLEFSSEGHRHITNSEFDQSINPGGGVIFDVIFPGNRGRWSLYNELFISTYLVESDYLDQANDIQYNNQLGYTYLNVNNMVRLKMPLWKASIFFNAGISNGFVIKETNVSTLENEVFGTTQITTQPVLDVTKSHELGLLMGSGLAVGRVSLEYRFEAGSGMSAYISLKSRTVRNYILVGFRLK